MTAEMFFGARIVFNPHLKDGTVLWFNEYAGFNRPGSSATLHQQMVIGTRPLTDLEKAGQEARLVVRRGLADVLEWLGQRVDNTPPTSAEILDGLRRHSLTERV